MEENELYDRIGETDLNPTYKDGQVYQHTDINNQVSIVKTAVNENYYDIQKMQKGEKNVGNSKKLDGATLSRYIDEELQADDDKIPSSQQAKAYMDALFAGYSAPVRGVDYWTESDQQQIVSDTASNVIEEINPDLEEALAAKANINDIPTKISDLQNDSDFLSENNLQMVKSSDIQNGTQLTDATGYARLNKINGNTVQNGTPTTNNPVDIDVVTGDVNVTISNADSSVSQNYVLSLGNIELCKIKTYKDYIHKSNGTWYLHKEIEKMQIDTSTITLGSNYTNIEYALIPKASDYVGYGIFGNDFILCSHATFSNGVSNWNSASNVDKIYSASQRNNWWLGFAKNTGLTTIKQKLTGGIIYYPLSASKEIEITNTTLISQLDEIYNMELFEEETNFVIASDGLLPSLNITYSITNRDFYSKEEVNDLLDNLKLKTKDYYFNSVSEMRTASLKVGDIANTTGYYNSNDGGGARYKIVENSLLTDDGGSIITLNNGYKAALIVENDTINIKQFGAYGDNTHDDTVPIQNALKFRSNDYIKVLFNADHTFLAQGYIDVYSNTDIIFKDAIIKDKDTSEYSGHHAGLTFRSAVTNANTTGYGTTKNINVIGGVFDGNVNGVMFALLHAENVNFNDIYFLNCFVGRHIIDMCGCKNIKIDNCNFDGCAFVDETVTYREMIQPDYARYSSGSYWGDDITGYDNLPTIDLSIENCIFKKGNGNYHPNAIGTHATDNLPHKNINIKNCEFYECTYACIRLPKVENLLIENNIFYNEDTTTDRSDHYAINLISLTETEINYMSNNINIINNKFLIDNGAGNLTGIGIKGDSDFTYAINNIKIKNNYFEGVYDSSDTSYGNDGIHLANVSDIIISDNVFNKTKNCIFKSSERNINNINLLNNTMKYCRDFTRGGGTATDEKTRTTNVYESNNFWTDATGTINLNDFKVIVTLDENSSIDQNGRILWGQSDNSFIYVNPANKSQIILPKHIHRFKITTAIFITPNATGIKELHGWVSYASDDYDIIPNQQYLQGSTAQYLILPQYKFKRESMISTTASLTIVTSATSADTLNATHYSDYLGTYVIIEGY